MSMYAALVDHAYALSRLDMPGRQAPPSSLTIPPRELASFNLQTHVLLRTHDVLNILHSVCTHTRTLSRTTVLLDLF
jgi:hypothetical protein